MPRMSLSDFSPPHLKATPKVRHEHYRPCYRGQAFTRRSLQMGKWRGKTDPRKFRQGHESPRRRPRHSCPQQGEHSTLFDLRAQAGLSRAQVGQALGISRSTWGDIERGTARLGKARAATLAALFQVPEHLVTTAAANTLQI